MPPLLEPDLLRTFLAIADSGSFTAAARRVHRTQSAVSMQIRRLEDQLGRSVLERDGRAVRLTPDGETLLGHARRILRLHEEALSAFTEPEMEGLVTIGTPDEYANFFLPPILARFAESYPRVQVNVICETSLNLHRMIDAGEVDLALITAGHGTASGTVLYREPVVWATSARHDVHERSPVPLALFQQVCIFRRWALDAMAAHDRPVRIAYTSLSFSGIEAALMAGLAVGVVARSTVRPGLRILGESDGFPPLPVCEIALHRTGDKPSAVLDRLERHFLDSFAMGQPQAA